MPIREVQFTCVAVFILLLFFGCSSPKSVSAPINGNSSTLNFDREIVYEIVQLNPDGSRVVRCEVTKFKLVPSTREERISEMKTETRTREVKLADGEVRTEIFTVDVPVMSIKNVTRTTQVPITELEQFVVPAGRDIAQYLSETIKEVPGEFEFETAYPEIDPIAPIAP